MIIIYTKKTWKISKTYHSVLFDRRKTTIIRYYFCKVSHIEKVLQLTEQHVVPTKFDILSNT